MSRLNSTSTAKRRNSLKIAKRHRKLLLESLEERRLLTLVGEWERTDPLGSLIFQANVDGEIGASVSVFSDDFESGTLGPEWTTSSSTQFGRAEVSSVLGAPANSGSFHLAMDTSTTGFNLNEAVVTLDLSGVTDAALSFAHKDVNDEDTPLLPTFAGSFNGDGVSISNDGTTWHTLVSLNNANSPNQVYTEFDFDLAAEATAAGISLGPDFQIKFQQFDNFPFSSDGRTFDDIEVTTPGSLSEITTAFLEADQTLTVVATPDDSSVTLTATVRDPNNVVLASATAAGAGETLDIQTIGIAADGNYTVEITGDGVTQYDLSLFRNATVEVVDTDDGSEQDATGSFIPLGSGRFGIVGSFDGSELPPAPQTVVFDFEEFSPPTPQLVSSLTATRDGIDITIEHENGVPFDIDRVLNASLFNAQFGFNALSPFNGQQGVRDPGGFVIDFSTPMSSVSVDMGDFGADGDQLQLQAYTGPGGTGTLVGQATSSLPPGGNLFGFDTLTVSGSSIGSIVMIGGIGTFPNSVYYDNITVTTEGSGPFTSSGQNMVLVDAGETNSEPIAEGGEFNDLVLTNPTPSDTAGIYGDPGEPGRFPPGPNVPAQPTAPGELLVNGSFEDGNFNGWTTVTTGSPYRPWAVSGAGQGGGFGMLQTQPQDGVFVAWNGFDGSGPMEFQMFQDVTIESGTTATLSWMDRVQWNFFSATQPRLYDVEIRDPVTNAVLQNVYSFSTGTALGNGTTDWQTHTVDVSAFAGQNVRVFFREQIPEAFAGPGQIEFDAISLTAEVGVETMYAGVGRGSPINPGGVLLVDQNTGAGTLLADPITPGGLTGVDFDSNDQLWGSSIDGPGGNRVSNLVELDPDTGALISSVPIRDGVIPISIGDLAIQPGTDIIFGIHSNADATGPAGELYTIDRATGAATLVGDTLQERGGGLAFAPDGTLYFLEFSELHTLDPASATILDTVTLPFGAHDGLGIRPSDGTLFATRSGTGTLGDEIRIIDPVGATSTLLGQTGTGNASDLAFRITVEDGGPDVDEYLLDLTGKAGQPIDIALSTDVESNGGAQFSDSLTEQDNVYFPNVLNFDFTDAPSPTGDATLRVNAIGDLDASFEYLALDAEGIFSQDLFVSDGLQQQPVSTTVTIPQDTLALLAADGIVSFTVTPTSGVNNLGSNSLTLELSYEASSGGNVTLELLDTDGTTVLASGSGGSDNFDLGILDFIVPADGIYTVRVSSDEQGAYGIVVTDPLLFDTEPNEPTSSTLRSLDAYEGALGFLGEGTAGSDVDLSLINSFESLSFPTDTGFIPPDPIIAAGPASVIAMVNTDIVIHDKTGLVITASDLDGPGGFWATNNTVFDPWIIYDPDSDRFIAMGVDRVTSGTGSSRIYLAVSTDSTPTNLTTDWNKYIIDRTGTHLDTGGTTFPDYPKLGVNDDALYITGNDFGITGGGFSHVSLFAVEKAPLLTGGPANIVYDEVITGAFSVHPVVNYDPGAPMQFAEAVGSTGIRLHTLDNVLTTGTRTTNTVGVPLFLFPPDVPQQGAAPLDSVSDRIMSGVVRDGSLWTAHAIQDPAVDTETVMRWYEFDVSGGTPTLVQNGNVDPGPGVHTWMGNINVDNDGDMAISFSVSGPTQFAGIGYTGRLASDPLGTTRPVETARSGEGPYALFDGIGRNRWGDYSGLAIDPDGETFWLYNEYAAVGNDWGTFVGSFQVEAGAPLPAVDTYQVTLAAGEQIGLSTITPFDGPIDDLNLLDPYIEVLDPSGVTAAFDSNSGSDGKNAALPSFTAATTGVYKVIVGAEDDGKGEYVLSVNWAPTVDNLALSADSIFENEKIALTGSYRDQNLGDSHAVVVDWDDPNDPNDSTFSVPAINTLGVGDTFNSTTDGALLEITALDLLAGEVSFEVVDHLYLDDGLAPGNGTSSDTSTVSVTITDNGGLVATPALQEFIVNGDFETGDFSGWSVDGTGSANWLINDGTLEPSGPGTPLAPISGTFDAVSIQSGPGVAILSEPIVVPTSVSSAVLSWSDRIRNYASSYVDPGQEWRVLVLDGGGNLIQEVFSTDPGDPLTQIGPNNRSFDLTTLFQSLAGQTVQLSFEQQSQLFFMNATLDNVSLLIDVSPSVVVKNVAPSLVLDPVAAINENEAATLTGIITDQGLLDEHDVLIDWNDPNKSNDSTFVIPATSSLSVGDTINSTSDDAVLTITAVDLSTGAVSFSVPHVYVDDGLAPGNNTTSDTSTISVTVVDDDFVRLAFPDFSDTGGLTLNGDATTTVTSDGTVVRLAAVEPPTFQVGSIFSGDTVNTADGFSTNFAFRITDPGGVSDGTEPGADGFTFTLQTAGPETLGVSGGDLGIGGVAPSIAVEFDTWQNAWDPSTNHLGIDVNGNISSVVAVDEPANKWDNGDLYYAWIDYDGSVLEVRVTTVDARPATPNLALGIDIPGILGQDDAFAGFTGATGGAWGNHDIVSWQLDDPVTAEVDVVVNNVAPSVFVNNPNVDVQYSDPIQTITFSAVDDSPLDVLNAAIAWKIAGDPSFTPGLPDVLTIDPGSLIFGGAPNQVGTGSWTISGIADLAPETYVFQITVDDDDLGSTSLETTLVVSQEDAVATWNGPTFVSSEPSQPYAFTIELRAVVQDITFFPTDPLHDPYGGDITRDDLPTGTVTFIIDPQSGGPTTEITANVLPIDSDPLTGVALATFTGELGNELSETFEITLDVGAFYTNENFPEESLVTVSRPTGDFITGGGYLLEEASYGGTATLTRIIENPDGSTAVLTKEKPIDLADGSKMNFGFNMKWNKKLTNLQGQFNAILRAEDATRWKVKSTATSQLLVDPETMYAEFTSKVNLIEQGTGFSQGGLTLFVQMTDIGEPGSQPYDPDTISFSLWDENTLIFSSNWDNSSTQQQDLAGGNVQVHVEQLNAAGSAASVSWTGNDLTNTPLQPVVDEAIGVWAATGLDEQELDLLKRVDVRIADLRGTTLGAAFGPTVWIDHDAAGYGWNHSSTDLYDRLSMDLLSVVTHEIGHILGYEHELDGVMAPTLALGVQQLDTSAPVGDYTLTVWNEYPGDLDLTSPTLGEISVTATDTSLLRPQHNERTSELDEFFQWFELGEGQALLENDLDGIAFHESEVTNHSDELRTILQSIEDAEEGEDDPDELLGILANQ